MSMLDLIAIGSGGFLGAISRHIVSRQMTIWMGQHFPYGTLLVNAAGSLLLGFSAQYLSSRMIANEAVRISLTIGFLGAFTTFSTFSNETILLIQDGSHLKALTNIISNVLICCILCYGGLRIARAL